MPHHAAWNEMATGGVVPGPRGAPVPIIAHGGEEYAGVGKTFRGLTLNIGTLMGDDASLRELVRLIMPLLGQDGRRTSFTGINRLGYFPGSSAP